MPLGPCVKPGLYRGTTAGDTAAQQLRSGCPMGSGTRTRRDAALAVAGRRSTRTKGAGLLACWRIVPLALMRLPTSRKVLPVGPVLRRPAATSVLDAAPPTSPTPPSLIQLFLVATIRILASGALRAPFLRTAKALVRSWRLVVVLPVAAQVAAGAGAAWTHPQIAIQMTRGRISTTSTPEKGSDAISGLLRGQCSLDMGG